MWISYSKKKKKKQDVLYSKRMKYSKYRKGRYSRVANLTVHNLVLEGMALKVVELVIFHIETLKQHVGLQSDNSIVL